MAWVFWIAVCVCLYVYGLYPLLVAALAKWRRSATQPLRPSAEPVSVVLVAHDEVGVIRARLENLLAQEPAGVVGEVVVVSDASSDGTDGVVAEISATDPRVRLIALPARSGKARGLNVGVTAARHEVVVFADARQAFTPDTVASLRARLAAPDVGAVSGELRFREPGQRPGVAASLGLYWRYETWIRRNEGEFDSVTGCPGAVYAIRRALFTPIPDGLLLDDVWVPIHVVMAGQRVVYEPNAVAWDDAQQRLDNEFRRKVRTLGGNLQLVLADPRVLAPGSNRLWWVLWSHKLGRLLVPFALVAALLSNLLLAGPWYRALLAAQALFYLLGVVGYARDKGLPLPRCRLCDTVRLFLSLNLAAVLGAVSVLSGRSQRLWVKTGPGG